MKIIENNYDKSEESIEVICPICDSKLEISDYDWQTDNYGKYFSCPCCKGAVYEDDIDISPTIDTLTYPRDYYTFASDNRMTDDEINEKVKKMLKSFDITDDNDYLRYCSLGSTIIFVYRADGEFYVDVCNNYSEATIGD